MWTFKEHWINIHKLDTIISIHFNLPPEKVTKSKDKEQIFEQDLTKKRPYLIIKVDEENLLVLTLTTNDQDGEEKEEGKKEKESKPSFSRFGPIRCGCLELDTYTILHTKIFITREFVRKFPFSLEKNDNKDHKCLSPEKFLKLGEDLDTYWNKENMKLITINLGTGKDEKKNKSRWKISV